MLINITRRLQRVRSEWCCPHTRAACCRLPLCQASVDTCLHGALLQRVRTSCIISCCHTPRVLTLHSSWSLSDRVRRPSIPCLTRRNKNLHLRGALQSCNTCHNTLSQHASNHWSLLPTYSTTHPCSGLGSTAPALPSPPHLQSGTGNHCSLLCRQHARATHRGTN